MNKPTLLLLSALVVLPIFGQTDDGQLDERLNPEIETAADVRVDYSNYPSVKIKNNKVSLNGDDWTALAAKYKAALSGDSLFSVVYLGDSHIQADFGGAVLRQRLSAAHSAGRGLIIPFRLAGTNEPQDYVFCTSAEYSSSKLMRTPWQTDMPFTGIAIKPGVADYDFSIQSPSPVSILRFHTCGDDFDVRSARIDGNDVGFYSYTDAYGTRCVSFDKPSTIFNLELGNGGHTVFGGVELLADTVGVLVHSVGNNGATYSDYANLEGFGPGLSSLHPDLVVVALGTNEAFGRISIDALQNNVVNLIDCIRRYSPDTKVMIVDRLNATGVHIAAAVAARPQVVNTKVADVARSIRLVAEDLNIPYYNHYAVAGSAASQRQARLLGRDGVHYTANGYRLWGNLLADAILEKLTQ